MRPIRIAFATEKYHHTRDSCYRFIEEATLKGWEVYWFVFEDIHLKDNKIYADLRRVRKHHLGITPKKMLTYEEKFEAPLEMMDVVYLKRDPPLPRKALHLVKNLDTHVMVVNDPHGILKYESKAALNKFKKFIAPSFFSHKIADLEKAIKKIGNCVVKEDDSNGGHGVHHVYKEQGDYYVDNIKVKHQKIDLKSFLKKATRNEKQNATVVKYLKRVGEGDKRILVVDNHIIGAIIRKPNTKNGWLCNIKSGGMVEKAGVTKHERTIIHSVAPAMAKDKTYVLGFDTLMDDDGKRILSEVNTVNVGAFHVVERLHKINASKYVMDFIEKKVKNRR